MGKDQSQYHTLLITGAAGFLGRELVAQALARGDRVIAVQRPSEWGEKAADPWDALRRQYGRQSIQMIYSDFSDPGVGDDIFRQVEERGLLVDGVVHAAAAMGNWPAQDEARLANQRNVNVQGTQSLALACEGYAECHGRQLPFYAVSSASARSYGEGKNPQLSYDRTKWESAQWLAGQSVEGHLPHLALTIGYPTSLLDTEPGLGLITQTVRKVQDGASPEALRVGLPLEETRRYTRRGRFVGEVLDALNSNETFREIDPPPDYSLTLGELIDRIEALAAKPAGDSGTLDSILSQQHATIAAGRKR